MVMRFACGFNQFVAGAGDVNNDGYDDLIVGNTYGSNNGPTSGSACIYSGLDFGVLYTFDGDNSGDRLGISVSGAGDVNADGYPDLIVGAYLDDNTGTDSGSARVFSGIDGATLYTFDGDDAGDEFGWSVSGAGDVNNDGHVTPGDALNINDQGDGDEPVAFWSQSHNVLGNGSPVILWYASW